MQIARRFTTEGRDPYETRRLPLRRERDPQPGRLGRLLGRGGRGAGRVEPGRLRHPRPEIPAQGRRAGASCARSRRTGCRPGCGAARADTEALAALPKSRAQRRRDQRQAMLRPARRHLDLLGLEGRLFRQRSRRRAPSTTRSGVMLARQMGAPNSPQWFNTGLYWAYGIDGPAQGHYYVDHRTGKVRASDSAYEHPQPHACFIQSVADDLVNEGGIMDLWVREARLFKYGSGTGSNFSKLRARRRETVGRRPLVRADELSEDRRPRRRRDQVGRHDAARRQDGHRRRRPPRYRALYRLEGRRGAEGRRAGRRLETGREAPEPDHGGCREQARGPVRSGAEPGPEARNPRSRGGR